MKKGIIIAGIVAIGAAIIGGGYLLFKGKKNDNKKAKKTGQTTVTKRKEETSSVPEKKEEEEEKKANNSNKEKEDMKFEKKTDVAPPKTEDKKTEKSFTYTPPVYNTNSIDYLPNVVRAIWEETKNSPKKKKGVIPLRYLKEDYALEEGRKPLYVYKLPYRNNISFFIEFPKINGKYDLTKVRERISSYKIAEDESYNELRITTDPSQSYLNGFVVVSYTLTDDNERRCVWIPIPFEWAIKYDKFEGERKSVTAGLINLTKLLERQIEKKVKLAETPKEKEKASLEILSGSKILIDKNAINILLEDVILAWEIRYPVQINKGPEEWGITPNQTIKLIKYFLNKFTQEVRFVNRSSTVSISRFDSLVFIDKLGSECQFKGINHDETANDQWLQYIFKNEETSSIYELKISGWLEENNEDDDVNDD